MHLKCFTSDYYKVYSENVLFMYLLLLILSTDTDATDAIAVIRN